MKTFYISILSVCCFVALSCNGQRTVDTQCTPEETLSEFEEIPAHDFSVVVTGDTVYFNVLEDKQSVALVYWGRSNFDNHVIEVTSTVDYQGTEYKVVEIGDEAMGVRFYGESEYNRLWSTDANQVERIILPTSVKRVGDAAFTARFRDSECRVELTDSVEYLGDKAVDCMSLCDENYAIVLPANLRTLVCLLDADDYEGDRGDFDGTFTKLYIPEHLECIGGLDNFGRDQPHFKQVEVHPMNKHFKAINGALYSYDLDSIYWSTVQSDLYIPKKLRVDKNTIAFLNDGWYPHMQMPQFESIVTEKGNPYCVAMDNVLYDIKNKCLIMPGGSKDYAVHVPTWCNSVYIIDGCGDSMPTTYIFDDEATQASVDGFISDLLHFTEDRPLTFIYKGNSWSNLR